MTENRFFLNMSEYSNWIIVLNLNSILKTFAFNVRRWGSVFSFRQSYFKD